MSRLALCLPINWAATMAYRVLLYTTSLPGDHRLPSEQAADLLDLRLWGLSDENQVRGSFREGDEVVVYAGAPEKAFVGHAVLASGFHRWSSGERRIYTSEFGEFSSGLAFSAARVWEEHLSLEEAWSLIGRPPLEFLRRAPDLSEQEFEALLAAAGQPRQLDSEWTWEEGARTLARHRALERRPAAVKARKSQMRTAHGRLFCEVCGTDGEHLYGCVAEGIFQCHHRAPLAEGPRTTRTADLAVVCASCHCALHATEPVPSVEQLRDSLEVFSPAGSLVGRPPAAHGHSL
jgi:hypothetical protein